MGRKGFKWRFIRYSGGVLSNIPGLDLLTGILSALAAIAPAVAAGTALATALATLFPQTTVTRLATALPNPITDLPGFLASPTVSSLLTALGSGDTTALLGALATMASSLLMQLIQGALL